jgi:hypothetical protein
MHSPSVFELSYWRSQGRMSWWEKKQPTPPLWHAQWAVDEYMAGRAEAEKREPASPHSAAVKEIDS